MRREPGAHTFWERGYLASEVFLLICGCLLRESIVAKADVAAVLLVVVHRVRLEDPVFYFRDPGRERIWQD